MLILPLMDNLNTIPQYFSFPFNFETFTFLLSANPIYSEIWKTIQILQFELSLTRNQNFFGILIYETANFWKLLNSFVSSAFNSPFAGNLIFSNALQESLLTNITSIQSLKIKSSNLIIHTLIFSFCCNLLKFNFFLFFILNSFCYTRVNFKWTKYLSYSSVCKVATLIECEKELGALDDFLLFFVFFFCLFGWYFLTTTITALTFNLHLAFTWVLILILNVFVLLIPTAMLIDFGIFFTSYIRGASNSSNLLLEIVFDLIGCLVVFIRFIVQNIRFVLIFMALFELYEWIYTTPAQLLISNLISITTFSSVEATSDLTTTFYYFSLIAVNLLLYFYYAIHLLALLFIQIGAYFLLSFWLFFFLYTSFFLTSAEKYFIFYRKNSTIGVWTTNTLLY